MRQPLDAPFDAVAQDYDAAFTETAVGRLQRDIVHRFLAQWKREQQQQDLQVLELNCGTGEDALWLAKQGCFVRATDISPEMVAITRAKAERAGLGEFIQTKVIDIQHISSIANDETRSDSAPSTVHRPLSTGFNLVFSNFGGLNCVSPEGLKNLGDTLPKLLKPGGHFIAIVMGRFCWWESLYFMLKGRFRAAFRRLSREPLAAKLDGQTTVETWYYSPHDCSAGIIFRHNQSIKTTLQPVGFWLPPSYLNPFFQKKPRFLHLLNQLEQKCRARIFAHGADHFLICIQNPVLESSKNKP